MNFIEEIFKNKSNFPYVLINKMFGFKKIQWNLFYFDRIRNKKFQLIICKKQKTTAVLISEILRLIKFSLKMKIIYLIVKLKNINDNGNI